MKLCCKVLLWNMLCVSNIALLDSPLIFRIHFFNLFPFPSYSQKYQFKLDYIKIYLRMMRGSVYALELHLWVLQIVIVKHKQQDFLSKSVKVKVKVRIWSVVKEVMVITVFVNSFLIFTIDFHSWFWLLILIVDCWFWFFIVDCNCRFWLLILIVDFDCWFWLLILIVDFDCWFSLLTCRHQYCNVNSHYHHLYCPVLQHFFFLRNAADPRSVLCQRARSEDPALCVAASPNYLTSQEKIVLCFASHSSRFLEPIQCLKIVDQASSSFSQAPK